MKNKATEVFNDPILAAQGLGSQKSTQKFKKQEHNLYSDSVAYDQSGPEDLRDTTQDAGAEST